MVASSARRPRGSTANSLPQQTLGGLLTQVLHSIPNFPTTTEQQKFRLGSRGNLYFEKNPAQHLSTYSLRTLADISQQVRLLCGHCKSCASYTVHMTLYEARHSYVVFVASRVVGDGNGASRPPVAGSAEFPGFALYKSVLLIISSFFFNCVLFKSRSRSVTVVSLKGSVSTALGAH